MQYLLITFVLLGLSRAQECPANCQCTDTELSCSSAQLTSVPQYMNTNVQILNFNNNSFRDINRDGLGLYSSAHVLDFGYNRLERIDDGAFQSNSALLKLNLGSNRLETIFMETFAGLESLTSLNLTANRIRNIALSMQLKRLRELYLGFNDLEHLDEDTFREVTNLRILDLRNNKITRIHPNAFSVLRHLRFLILKNNPLRAAASDLNLSQNHWLHVLDLTNCRIEKELTNLPKRLRDVRLSYNNITTIDQMFKNALYIDMIILNDNNLLTLEAESLDKLPYLRELWLNRNKLSKIPGLPKYIRAVHIDDNTIDSLDANSFRYTPFVEIISLQNNKIKRLPSESFRNLRLRMIDVSMNEIAVLQRYTFSNLPVLYSVDLSRNPIQRLDVRSFDNVTNLHWLQMARTKVDMVEVESLEMLHMMNKLQYLDLTSSPGVANKLIQSGVVLEEVRTLNLMFNDLTTLPQNFPEQIPNIRMLHLSGNKWHCNKSLSWLPDYILENDQLFFAKSHIVCYTPLKWRGRAIHTLEIDEMNAIEGPPTIDVEPCLDCKEPCDEEGPEVVEGDGGAGVQEGGELGPEPGELVQADEQQVTTRKVEKFRGKILMVTTPSTPTDAEADTDVAAEVVGEETGGARLESLSLTAEGANKESGEVRLMPAVQKEPKPTPTQEPENIVNVDNEATEPVNENEEMKVEDEKVDNDNVKAVEEEFTDNVNDPVMAEEVAEGEEEAIAETAETIDGEQETNADDEEEVQKVDVTTSSGVETTEENEVETTVSSDAGTTAASNVETTSISDVETTTATEVATTAASKVNTTFASEVKTTAASEVEATAANVVDTTAASEVVTTAASEVETTEASQVTTTAASDVETTQASKVETTAANEIATTEVNEAKTTEVHNADSANAETNKADTNVAVGVETTEASAVETTQKNAVETTEKTGVETTVSNDVETTESNDVETTDKSDVEITEAGPSTEDPKLAQRRRDDEVWSMMARMFKF